MKLKTFISKHFTNIQSELDKILCKRYPKKMVESRMAMPKINTGYRTAKTFP